MDFNSAFTYTQLHFLCSWDLYSWPQEGEIDAFFVDHYPIFSETYLIAEEDDVETWEEINATEAFYAAFLTTDEEVLVRNVFAIAFQTAIVTLSDLFSRLPMNNFDSIPVGTRCRYDVSRYRRYARLGRDSFRIRRIQS